MTLAEIEKFLRDHDCRMMWSMLAQEFLVVVNVKGFEVGRGKAKTLEAAITYAMQTAKFPAAR